MPNRSKNALIGPSVGVNRLSHTSATATCVTTKGTTKNPRWWRQRGMIFSSPTAISVPAITCAITPNPLSAGITQIDPMNRLSLASLEKLLKVTPVPQPLIRSNRVWESPIMPTSGSTANTSTATTGGISIIR